MTAFVDGGFLNVQQPVAVEETRVKQHTVIHEIGLVNTGIGCLVLIASVAAKCPESVRIWPSSWASDIALLETGLGSAPDPNNTTAQFMGSYY